MLFKESSIFDVRLPVDGVVVVVAVVEASAPKVYPRGTRGSTSTLSGLVVRT